MNIQAASILQLLKSGDEETLQQVKDALNGTQTAPQPNEIEEELLPQHRKGARAVIMKDQNVTYQEANTSKPTRLALVH